MGTPLDGVDVVDVGIDVFVKGGVIGQSHFHGNSLAFRVEMNHVGDQFFLRGVDIPDELAQTVGRIEHLAAGITLLVKGAHIGQRKGNSGVKERQVAQTLGKGIVVVDSDSENRGVRKEGHRCSMLVGLPYDLKFGGRLADGILLAIDFAPAAHFGTQICRKGVHAAYADTMKTSGHLIGSFVELTSGMKDGQHYFQGAFVFFLVHIHGDTASVVDHAYRVVLVDCHFDMRAEARKSLVDGVVNNFIDKMMKSFGADVADIHCRAFAHGFQSLEDLDITGAVFLFVSEFPGIRDIVQIEKIV